MSCRSLTPTSLPRIRGGVSVGVQSGGRADVSSPHTRGCFSVLRSLNYSSCVFPAYAGVFLMGFGNYDIDEGLPRIRGGVSLASQVYERAKQSSPHTRGCFSLGILRHRRHVVFPAYAGVFPISAPRSSSTTGLPRIRGGVSGSLVTVMGRNMSSPHTRGCFFRVAMKMIIKLVFPAYAGVFPHSCSPCCSHWGLPRIRGGVSALRMLLRDALRSSPHTRGCF